MNLLELIQRWLADEMPEWKITKDFLPKNALGCITYGCGLSYPCVYVFEDYVEFLDSDLKVLAYNEKFFPLLSNRLHMMQSGFRKAMRSRGRNDRNSS